MRKLKKQQAAIRALKELYDLTSETLEPLGDKPRLHQRKLLQAIHRLDRHTLGIEWQRKSDEKKNDHARENYPKKGAQLLRNLYQLLLLLEYETLLEIEIDTLEGGYTPEQYYTPLAKSFDKKYIAKRAGTVVATLPDFAQAPADLQERMRCIGIIAEAKIAEVTSGFAYWNSGTYFSYVAQELLFVFDTYQPVDHQAEAMALLQKEAVAA